MPDEKMTIFYDTREQLPYDFMNVREPVVEYDVVKRSLKDGDYQVLRPFCDETKSNTLVLERKSLEDLHGTVGRGRARFERELARFDEYGYKALVIEADWYKILCPEVTLTHGKGINPRAMFASLIAWSQRFNVHVFTFSNRPMAEIGAYRIMERWFRDGLKAQQGG